MGATPETANHEPDGDESGNWDSPLLPGRTYSYTRNGRTVHIINVETRPGEAAWIEVGQGTPVGNRSPTGSLTANASVLEYGQTSYLVASVTDPDGDDLAHHWMIPDRATGETNGPYPNQRLLPVHSVYCHSGERSTHHRTVATRGCGVWRGATADHGGTQ